MPGANGTEERDVDAVMGVSRALVAIVARSFAESDVAITLQQWRVLVIVGDYGPMTSGALAGWMEVHPSNATRTCDGLVRLGLLDRRDDPVDRRRTTLTLSARGEELTQELLDHRRRAIRAILEELPAGRRDALVRTMRAFADAAGDHPEHFVSGDSHAGVSRIGS
ncbi:MAG: winged helix-turn-helix transcriptional regulator [Nocardioidaceae bacterium]|nr:winged helix-turn-helix transcriptional regulator [Nocardioidaceae bacterium]NUS52767.1 winged helix-turn-helix transcriptional regulator [Nocardioidaceae bacterium]